MPQFPFPELFEHLTGHPPFPWQVALYERFMVGEFSISTNIPTGLGKTNVITIWLLALARKPEGTPRRLVYVVNRRTVVDQTTSEVEKLRKALAEKPELEEVRDALATLCALPLPDDTSPLALSTLRGQYADNGEWCLDPARPAVICGTVDMIGSGLLFSRYTAGFKMRPLHAGFLAQDALLVHDEAHLEPAFQKLLGEIETAQKNSADPRKLHVLELTATTRANGGGDGTQKPPPFGLDKNPDDKDTENEFIQKRIHAPKRLSSVPLGNNEKLEKEIIALAEKKAAISERAVLVFVRLVETALKVRAALNKKGEIATLTGTMRGKERDELVRENAVFQRFLHAKDRAPGIEPATGPVFLVATSAGEVGVNLSADDLVCDLSTYESMAQRFGRVNRFGELVGDAAATITVFHETDIDTAKPFDAARARTLALLKKLDGDASPAALAKLSTNLSDAERAAAFSPEPGLRTATAIQFDAWALTTIRKSIAARPPVAPYLHGEAEWQQPETHVAWREELDVLRTAKLLDAYSPEDLLEGCPLKPHELLRDTSGRIFKTIQKIAQKTAINGNLPGNAWLIRSDGDIDTLPLADFLKEDPRDTDTLEASLANATLILPASLGGIDKDGLLSSAATDDKHPAAQADVSDIQNQRCRVWSDTPELPADLARAGFRIKRLIDTQSGLEELPDEKDANEKDADDTNTNTDGATTATGACTSRSRYWLWLETKPLRTKNKNDDNNNAATLEAHTQDVTANAIAIAAKIFPRTSAFDAAGPDLRRCLVIAAQLHDLGKNRAQWQRNLGNFAYDPARQETILAKSAPGMRSRNLAEHYRHEFGSLNDVARDPEAASSLAALSGLEREIVLHLIAAHHGRARPHFPDNEIFDYPGAAANTGTMSAPAASSEKSTTLATETPRRFARLQKRFGRWGLAWLESLLRAADHAASAGIVAPCVAAAAPENTDILPAPENVASSPPPPPGVTLNINPANPGHYFACCGLFELAAALVPEACAWFAKDGSTFHIAAAGLSLKELLGKIVASEINALDPEDRPLTPLEIILTGDDARRCTVRIDWWRHEGGAIGKLKTWAGQMSVRDIADDMRKTLKPELGHPSPPPPPPLPLEDILFLSSTANSSEPFYFDANRATNAKAQDVGFSVDKLRKGSVKITSPATPAVELLCLIGLQRARPLLAVNKRGKEREYDYHLWHSPLPLAPLAAAVAGLLPDSTHRFRFSNPSRAKDYRAFVPANRVS
ncbi:MAG: type I-U CRISPR-associated helicase/endonuclease Cas3 [Opitutaceae bacterium]|jgi:CRISPR-associated endonuclease/helicase Cas3|nr:type I-U CRISPR-associated helicase/endonuclease Cas3 [Opitutaceae bacterium]